MSVAGQSIYVDDFGYVVHQFDTGFSGVGQVVQVKVCDFVTRRSFPNWIPSPKWGRLEIYVQTETRGVRGLSRTEISFASDLEVEEADAILGEYSTDLRLPLGLAISISQLVHRLQDRGFDATSHYNRRYGLHNMANAQYKKVESYLRFFKSTFNGKDNYPEKGRFILKALTTGYSDYHGRYLKGRDGYSVAVVDLMTPFEESEPLPRYSNGELELDRDHACCVFVTHAAKGSELPNDANTTVTYVSTDSQCEEIQNYLTLLQQKEDAGFDAQDMSRMNGLIAKYTSKKSV